MPLTLEEKREIRTLFLGDDYSKVAKWFELFKDPVFKPKVNMSWEEIREKPMINLRKIS